MAFNFKHKPHDGQIFKRSEHITWNGKKVLLRSSYELEYALKLDSQKVNYEVEGLKIKYWNTKLQKYCTAIPDFYLTETNTIIEVKGQYFFDRQEIKDKFKTYKEKGFNCKLILDGWEVKDVNLI